MELNQYQFETSRTALYRDKPNGPILYPTLEINGEAGEIADKVKKLIRDGNGLEDIPFETKEALALEIGDVLWGLATLSEDLGYTLGHVAAMNLKKLSSRYDRGAIAGSGDER